jgi:hypothetical protein
MDVLYTLTAQTVMVEEEVFNCYGISCEARGKPIRRIDDISCDRQLIEEKVKQFNALGLSEEHFQDAVEDILC